MITDNIARILTVLPPGVRLLAASKTRDKAAVREAIAAGVHAVGENRVQELLTKNAQGAYEGAPLHFIGHLQKNKAKQLVGVCNLIESVDSEELLAVIDRLAEGLGIVQDVLLEVNIGAEASKSGFRPEELRQIMETLYKYDGIRVLGLMAIPPISEKNGDSRRFFVAMYKLFVDIGTEKYDNGRMSILSMGMSGDFQIAAEEGANLVRVGTGIFGERSYQ